MDIHRNVDGLTADAVAGAHQKDLETQEKYGVKYRSYWYNEKDGTVFCLAEGPARKRWTGCIGRHMGWQLTRSSRRKRACSCVTVRVP
ncbi:MAG TPA: nickel-binding protein [Chloroflexota bacterium]|nr:nickel-binding protein [Chloroflexota bacterium]